MNRIKTLLMIDNDPEVRMQLRQTLVGWRLLEASDSRDGLVLARACRPDAIIVDSSTPGLSDSGVMRSLREDQRTAGIPIVLLSERQEMPDLDRPGRADVDAYVPKPVRPITLMSAMEMLFDWLPRILSKSEGGPSLA